MPVTSASSEGSFSALNTLVHVCISKDLLTVCCFKDLTNSCDMYVNTERRIINFECVHKFSLGTLTKIWYCKEDLSKQQLQAQLPLLKSSIDVSDNIVKLLSKMSSAQRVAFSNVWIIQLQMLLLRVLFQPYGG